MRQYLTSMILILTLPVGEMHTFFSDTKVENWIINAYVPMPETWNVKLVANELTVIMYFAAWILYVPNKTNRSVVSLFFCLAVIDALLYFYNYKLYGFGWVYYGFAVSWLLITNGKYILKWR